MKHSLIIDDKTNKIFLEYCVTNNLNPNEAISLAITQLVVGACFTTEENEQFNKLMNNVIDRITNYPTQRH